MNSTPKPNPDNQGFHVHGKLLPPEEAVAYVQNYRQGVMSNPGSRYRILAEMAPTGLKTLDYGCGWGHFSKTLSDQGNIVTGIDSVPEVIELSRLTWGESEKLTFRQGTIKEIDAESMELVNSNQVIEHVHNPGSYLHEINRVLRPAGRLLISIPNVITPRFIAGLFSPRLEDNLRKISTQTLARYNKQHDHIQAWDPSHFVRLLATVGFQLDDFRPMEGVPLPRKRFLPAYIHSRLFKNFSYTMGFLATKVQDSAIGPTD